MSLLGSGSKLTGLKVIKNWTDLPIHTPFYPTPKTSSGLFEAHLEKALPFWLRRAIILVTYAISAKYKTRAI